MNLLLIRHGQSEADILGVMEGRADFPLTSLGKEQAHAMASWMKSQYQLDKIITSPLQRAAQTAEILKMHTGATLSYDDNLMEWQNGLVAGMPYQQAIEQCPLPDPKYPHTEVYEQESDIQFRMRAETALSKIIHENAADATIAVVSHNGLIGQLLQSFLRLPIQSGVYFEKMADTGIHQLEVSGNKRGVLALNMQKHFKQ